MSDQRTSTAARLAFYEPEGQEPARTPSPSPVRAAVDAAASGHAATEGPAKWHHLHGALAIRSGEELRITTQPSRRKPGGFREPARILIRPWYRRIGEDTWWPSPDAPGVSIAVNQAAEFGQAVASAVAHLLAREPKR